MSMEDRLAAIEQRLGMSDPQPFDRLSGLDLRLDSIQNLMQSFGLTQNQIDRKITSIETRTLKHDQQLERVNADLQTIIAMLSQIIARDEEPPRQA